MSAIEKFKLNLMTYPPIIGGDKGPDFEVTMALAFLELIERVELLEEALKDE